MLSVLRAGKHDATNKGQLIESLADVEARHTFNNNNLLSRYHSGPRQGSSSPMGISQYLLAKDIGVDPRRINANIHGKRAITADTALRPGRYFGIESEFWMNLQTHYDLEVESDRLAGKLEQEVKIHSAA